MNERKAGSLGDWLLESVRLANPDGELTASGRWTRGAQQRTDLDFTLTAKDLTSFTGTKAVSVELLGASGAAVSGNPVAVSLTGTGSSGGDSGSGGSSGGGSFGWLTLGLLGLAGLKKRK